MGFAPNDIRAVASRSFLEDHPAIEALLTELTIPLEDISDQNARMIAGEDITAAAATWIAHNRDEVDGWLEEAVAAHIEAGLSPSPAPISTGPTAAAIGRSGSSPGWPRPS